MFSCFFAAAAALHVFSEFFLTVITVLRIATKVQIITFFYTRLVKFRITGYYSMGWLWQAGSQDTDFPVYVLISSFCCTMVALCDHNPSMFQTDGCHA